jgi:hypothetical protein
MNQADKPKCKVVVRDFEGKRGARIHPKGCRVAKRVMAPGGAVRKVDKRGRLKADKLKVKVTDVEYAVNVRAPDGSHVEFIYDTGATSSTANYAVARQFGLINSDNQPTGTYQHRSTTSILADGSRRPVLKFLDVPFRLRETGQTSVGAVTVSARSSMLYGVSHMRGQRKYLKVKFK